MKSPYERMLRALQSKGKQSRAGRKEKWFLYILQCSDGTFYTGITKDIERRLKADNDGKGVGFTRTRRPVKVIYQETLKSRTQALVREYTVKALPRKKKEELITSYGCPSPP